MGRPLLEVCAADIDSVIAAAHAGADRVELCSALSEGGVTPSFGFIRQALGVPDIRVHVLIRPRGGDFVYSASELDVMVQDVRQCATMGVHGVVIGALCPDGSIDMEACRRLVDAAGGMSVTFHRAFDLVSDVEAALACVVELGCDRLLTSGCAPSVDSGAPLLRHIRSLCPPSLRILAGGGVSPANAAALITSGAADELHASAKHTVASRMTFRNESVKMGAPDSDEYSRHTASPIIISQIINALNSI